MHPTAGCGGFIRNTIHFLSYHMLSQAADHHGVARAGFALTVPPTVFHPRVFLTSRFFAEFIGDSICSDKHVAEVGTGSGILALAAARAGAANVVAIDINPNAARAAADNAKRQRARTARDAGLLEPHVRRLRRIPLFDVILSSPPSFAGEPRDLADRAWHAGPRYRDIAVAVRPGARAAHAGRLPVPAAVVGFRPRPPGHPDRAGRLPGKLVAERSIFFESFILYELRPS